ncbi:hypothetical protein CsSME_00031086 [Camellia sinensis var. sinensis]
MEAVIWISIGACLVRLCWEKGCLNSELWHACAGPLVSLPAVGSRVVYFPQGHSEQGDNVPPYLTSFEATGFPSELLREVVEFALALQEAGCFSVVLKCVLVPVAAAAAAATSALRILTIGIGAGTFCSGQVN